MNDLLNFDEPTVKPAPTTTPTRTKPEPKVDPLWQPYRDDEETEEPEPKA